MGIRQVIRRRLTGSPRVLTQARPAVGELRKWRGGLAWSRPGAGPEPEVLRVCRMPVGPARAEQKLARFLVKGLGSGFRLRGFILPLTLDRKSVV